MIDPLESLQPVVNSGVIDTRAATTVAAVETLRTNLLGVRGSITEFRKVLPSLETENAKKFASERINAAVAFITSTLNTRRAELEA